MGQGISEIRKLCLFSLTLLLLVASSSCGRSFTTSGGPYKVLLSWQDSDFIYKPQVVWIHTLDSIRAVDGSAARVYVAEGRRVPAQTAKPHMIRSGELFVPQDTNSAVALAAYAHMERIQEQDARIYRDKELSWPRRVVVGAEYQADARDNASYFPESDSIMLTPYRAGSIPLEVNGGVLAHEHFHAHFYRTLKVKLGAQANENQMKLVPHQPLKPLQYNAFMNRALNEGLADFYGMVYSKNPRFMEPSINHRASYRSMDGDVRMIPSTEGLADELENPERVRCEQTVCVSYAAAVSVSRFFYQWTLLEGAGIWNDDKALDILMDVFTALEEYSKEIQAEHTTRSFDLARLIEIFLESRPVAQTPAACGLLNAALGKGRQVRRSSSCL